MNALLSFIKKFLPKKSNVADAHLHVARDWFMLLGGILILLIVSIVWNIWYFGVIANEEDATQTSGGQSALETYPAGTIQEVFNKRNAADAAYRTEYKFVDPSR